MKAKRVFLMILTVFLLGYMNGFVYPQEPGGRIAMIIARNNFRDEELLEPKAVFEDAGYEVVIFSSSSGRARGMLGAVVSVDKVIDELNPEEYDAVVFVGGAGASEYWDEPEAHQIARDAKVVAAICIAPVTLARAGLLRGKRATVWPSEGRKLQQEGAIYTGADVEISGNIVTADGPQSAREFAEAILGLLK